MVLNIIYQKWGCIPYFKIQNISYDKMNGQELTW
jgi:hypothetical protein